MSRPAKAAKPQPTYLYLSTNSLKNTVFSAPSDSISYEVRTTWWDPTITRIRRLNSETRELTLVAELERKPHSEPRLRLNWQEGFEEFRNASDWLKVSIGSKMLGCFTGIDGESYRWTVRKGRLQLCKEDDSSAPLVSFHKHERHFYVYWRMSKHAALELSPECLPNTDAIILSYLLVERMRRDSFLGTKG